VLMRIPQILAMIKIHVRTVTSVKMEFAQQNQKLATLGE
jgi:hypothetical protein